MELNFDKEMDALLRQTARQQTTAGPPIAEAHLPEAHLDADTLAAFSANALPVKARERAMGHLVDCGNCRTILSNLVFFENEEEESKAAFATVSAPAIKGASLVERIFSIFKFPALAYGMAALVLVFAGAIGVMVWRGASDGPQLAQLSKDEAMKPAPAAAQQSDTGLVSNYTVQANSNSSANSLASAANAAVDGAFAVPSSVGSGYGTASATESDAPTFKRSDNKEPAMSDDKLRESPPELAAPAAGAPPLKNLAPAPAVETMKSQQELPAGRQVQNAPIDQINTQQRQDNYRNNNNILTPDGSGGDRGRRSSPALDSRAVSNEARDEEEKLKDDATTTSGIAGAAKAAGKPVDKDAKSEQKKSAEKKKKRKASTNADAAEKEQPAAKPSPTPKKPDEELPRR
jgi:hypothetical protein